MCTGTAAHLPSAVIPWACLWFLSPHNLWLQVRYPLGKTVPFIPSITFLSTRTVQMYLEGDVNLFGRRGRVWRGYYRGEGAWASCERVQGGRFLLPLGVGFPAKVKSLWEKARGLPFDTSSLTAAGSTQRTVGPKHLARHRFKQNRGALAIIEHNSLQKDVMPVLGGTSLPPLPLFILRILMKQAQALKSTAVDFNILASFRWPHSHIPILFQTKAFIIRI